MANKNSKNSTEEFICTNCNYTCFKIHHYNQHLLTAKHKRLTNTIFLLTKNSTEFTCSHCNKHYKHMSSLINNKKKCQSLKIESETSCKYPLFQTVLFRA